jgi:hydroxypyruvate isomerase
VSLKFCANLNYLFTELPLLDRFEAAAKAGFKGVELLVPYEAPAASIRDRLDGAGLQQVLINSPSGDRARGERGMACLPGRETQFRESVLLALDYASALGCRLVHLMAGIVPEDISYDAAAAHYFKNLSWAADLAHKAGVRLAIEAINQKDLPGYFLRTQEQAAAFVTDLDKDRVGLQFDIYHCQTAQGDVTRRLEALMPLIAHMQIADAPGRHEPGTGELRWAFLFKRIEQLGYRGWIGCEYQPRAGTIAGLAWRESYGAEHA